MSNNSDENEQELLKNADKLGVMLGNLKWILFISFFVLKLVGKMDIAWVWVFAPLWIPFVVGFIILLKISVNFSKK